jgi:NADPH-dependent 2,4-dienoyl-CoA reductase/sulfur reductase-like enzyme
VVSFRWMHGRIARRSPFSPKRKTVELRNVATGEVATESYDKLVLSPGAPSVRPPLPGSDLPGIFQVRTMPDARTIREWIEGGTTFLAGRYNYSGIQFVKPARRAVVLGGGFSAIGTKRTSGDVRSLVAIAGKADTAVTSASTTLPLHQIASGRLTSAKKKSERASRRFLNAFRTGDLKISR